MSSNTLTDREIYKLLRAIMHHYKDQKSGDIHLIGKNLQSGFYKMLDDDNNNGFLSHLKLDNTEKEKTYTLLKTFIQATPEFRELTESQREAVSFINTKLKKEKINKIIINNYNYPRYYRRGDEYLDDWRWPFYSGRNYYGTGFFDGFMFGSCWGNGGTSSNSDKNEEDAGSIVAAIVLVVFASAIAILAVITAYYLLSEMLDACEKLFMNEGWMQAMVSFMSMAASATASAILSEMFVAGPVASLAVSAGFAGPAGWALFAVIGLSIIGAATGRFISLCFEELVKDKMYADAMDPQDPQRFRLTDNEIKRLEEKGLDPLKVKFAMAALRNEMDTKEVPSLLNRLCTGHGQVIRGLLAQVRDLRKGNISELEIGKLKFNLAKDSTVDNDCDASSSMDANDMNDACQEKVKNPKPSAPPLTDEVVVACDRLEEKSNASDLPPPSFEASFYHPSTHTTTPQSVHGCRPPAYNPESRGSIGNQP